MAIHPLQSSGAISVADIQAELGVTVGGSFSFQNWNGYSINQNSPSKPTPGGSESLGEWYGYNHNYSPADTTPPTAPTLSSIYNASAQTITLSWTAGTDNVAVAGYLLEAQLNGTGYYDLSSQTGRTYVDYVDSGTYNYRVRAWDVAGRDSEATA